MRPNIFTPTGNVTFPRCQFGCRSSPAYSRKTGFEVTRITPLFRRSTRRFRPRAQSSQADAVAVISPRLTAIEIVIRGGTAPQYATGNRHPAARPAPAARPSPGCCLPSDLRHRRETVLAGIGNNRDTVTPLRNRQQRRSCRPRRRFEQRRKLAA